MAYRINTQGGGVGGAPFDIQRANYWNQPMWGYGSRGWYGIPSYAGPYYGGMGYGYGSSGAFFDTNPFPGYGGADLDFGNLGYAIPNAGRGPGAGWGAEAGSGFLQRRSYAGVGPRSYVRSIERIRDDINDRLTAHANIDASDVRVEVDDGIVTLTGTVDSRFAKRTAGDIAETTYGVSDVRNQLTIRSTEEASARPDRTGTRRGSAARSRA